MDEHYRRVQIGWVTIVALSLTIGVCVAVFAAAQMPIPGVIVSAILAAVALVFGWLTVVVDDEHITARFGIGLLRKRFALSRIRKFEAVVSPWYWGWGIRMYPGGWMYNVSGLQAVELTLDDGTRLRIGTAEPDRVCAVLGERLGELSPLTEAQEAVAKTQGTKAIWIGLAIVGAVMAAVGVGVYAESRPPTVEVSGTSVSVDGLMYDATVDTSDLDQFELTGRLPAIRARTNGFAAGDQLRGHFRLDEFGACQLFIDRGVAPFIVMRKPGQCVVINTPDPARTQEIYDQLVAADPR